MKLKAGSKIFANFDSHILIHKACSKVYQKLLHIINVSWLKHYENDADIPTHGTSTWFRLHMGRQATSEQIILKSRQYNSFKKKGVSTSSEQSTTNTGNINHDS